MASKITRKLSSQYARYSRVWKLLKKPTIQEFKTVSKVSAVGILIIGAIGFAIATFMKLFTSGLF